MAIYQGTNKVSGLSVNESVPVGTVVSFASNNIPNGWWICDGREVSRTDYKQLFDAIGTTWGDGNGSTTFNIPNTKDLFIQGANGNIGETIDAGLPNITGFVDVGVGDIVGTSGSFALKDATGWYTNATTAIAHTGFSLNASKGETKTDGTLKTEDEHHVYGSSDTVQPPSVCMNYIIKYSNVLMSEVKVIDDSVIAEDKCYSSQKTVDVIDEKVKEVYSTEEKVIGTWIDGKPIYRKVINEILSNNVDVSNLNIDNLIVGDAFVHYQNNYYMISTVSGISDIIMYFANKTTIKFDAQVAIQCSYIILEYTKTTD